MNTHEKALTTRRRIKLWRPHPSRHGLSVGDQPSLFESGLPEERLRLPVQLARLDALLDDPTFLAPFVPFFDPRMGRPSTPMETYLRLMF